MSITFLLHSNQVFSEYNKYNALGIVLYFSMTELTYKPWFLFMGLIEPFQDHHLHPKMRMKTGFFLLTLSIIIQGCSQASDLQTVESVDLDRYIGTWHEIARLPNTFQKACTANTTAQYRQIRDGRIAVINRCMREDGSYQEAQGVARIVDSTSNARLEVSFVSLLGFQLFWGDYWIIGLDEQYRYSIVGAPSRKYGWILSRDPQMPDDLLAEAFSILEAKGYDRERFVFTKQIH